MTLYELLSELIPAILLMFGPVLIALFLIELASKDPTPGDD